MATVAKTFDRQTAKFMAVVGENMPQVPGPLMQEWIEHPLDLQRALWKALCPLGTVPTPPTWRTVKLGTHKSADALVLVLTYAGRPVGEIAATILEKIGLDPAEREVDLVKISVRDLGLTDGGTREEIYDRARRVGLETVPAETGPQLALQLRSQRRDEWILVGMEPVTDSRNCPYVFAVGRKEDTRWLAVGDGTSTYFWDADTLWVFNRKQN